MFNLSRSDPPEKRPPNRTEGSKTEPFKRLSWMISNPPPAPVRITITPELAAEMLTYNVGNRPLSSGAVKSYAEQMKAGLWRETFETIQFSHRLLQGQHRLHASVDSGCAFVAWVAFGADDKTFAYIDIGKKRTAGDIFAINGVGNHTVVAAAVKWIWGYENHERTNRARAASFASGVTDPGPLFEYYKTLDAVRLQASAKFASKFSAKRLPNPTLAVGVHYVCSGKSKAHADEFFEKVATGIGFTSKSDPAYKLRDRLTDASKPLSRAEQAVYMIEAWNAARLGRKVSAFEYRGGPLPRVV